ncbi:MAG TPA: TetR/AcrR family transcriptional regulator [Reyranella sp.]|nr:TetR/AcrR family transcriptional regulator [Reyranella sp.]
MPPLPAPLAGASPTAGKPLSKRERTRGQLILAAISVFSANGVAASTMQQVAAEAGMTTGTVYNHFHSKTEIVAAVARQIAETIRQRSMGARATLGSDAEQIAAGCRRYLGLARSSPAWALLILDVASVDPAFRKTITGFVRSELRHGLRSGEFTVVSEAAGLDLVIGGTMEAMRRIATGEAPRNHATVVVAAILRGLGISSAAAQRIAAKPLPLFDR